MELTHGQQAIVLSAMEKQQIPGVSVAIVKNGTIVSQQGFGVRNLDTGEPMTPHTVQPICSLTKSFTGVCIMGLAEAGVLSLDEPVVSYLPWFRIADKAATAKITPRMLLSHRSGLGRTGHQNHVWTGEVVYKSRADLVSRLADYTPQTQPNVAWSYCNEGYVTLGVLVDTLSGSLMEETLRERIFEPLSMTNTYPSFARWRESRDHAVGYIGTPAGLKQSVLPSNYSNYLSTGGIASSAHDIALYQIASMDHTNSPLLSAGSLDLMQSVSTLYGDTGWGYGLGWGISWSGENKVVSHGGALSGIATFSLMIPAAKTGVVVLTNRGGARTGQLAQRLLESFIGSPLFPPIGEQGLPFATNFPMPVVSRLSEFESTYVFGKQEINVQAVDRGLSLTIPVSDESDERVTVVAIPVSHGLFMGRHEDASVMVQFVRRGREGEVRSLLMGGNQYMRAEN